jgi:hypothetical protein
MSYTMPMMSIAPAVAAVPPAVNVAVEDLFEKSIFSADFWKSFAYFQARMYLAWTLLALALSVVAGAGAVLHMRKTKKAP